MRDADMQLMAYYVLKGHDLDKLAGYDYSKRLFLRSAMELEQEEITRG